jgi:lipoprotein signal peptidase
MWYNELGLSVNPDKTGLIAFTRRKLPGFFERFFGMTLCCPMSIKYLVVLDSRLTWREHVDVKVRKAHNLFWACRRAYGVAWGLRPRVVQWLYISIIRLSIIFASWVWWPGCQTAPRKN